MWTATTSPKPTCYNFRHMEYSEGRHIGDLLKNKKIRLRPRFTIVHHPVREKFELSMTTYAVIDSIHQLSHRPNYPWCTQSKAEIAKFILTSDRHVFRAIKEAIAKGLLEQNEKHHLRSTEKWILEVVLYESKPMS